MNATRLRGFAIVAAIFILVVLAALGAFILSVSSSQQLGSALDVQGARAYQAARAGIEWGLYQVQATPAYNFSYGTPPTTVGAVDGNLRSCASASGSFALFGFTVTVECAPFADTQGGPTAFRLRSTACSQPHNGRCPNTTNPGQFYVERRLELLF